MAQIDPNEVASAGIQDLQKAINTLAAMIPLKNANIPGINAKIDALQAQQADLRNQALRTIEDLDENKRAIARMNAAAALLRHEAGNITSVANALTDAAKVVNTAVALMAALARFA